VQRRGNHHVQLRTHRQSRVTTDPETCENGEFAMKIITFEEERERARECERGRVRESPSIHHGAGLQMDRRWGIALAEPNSLGFSEIPSSFISSIVRHTHTHNEPPVCRSAALSEKGFYPRDSATHHVCNHQSCQIRIKNHQSVLTAHRSIRAPYRSGIGMHTCMRAYVYMYIRTRKARCSRYLATVPEIYQQ
jgi:hypothetical protein